jgi:hypothetical protein
MVKFLLTLAVCFTMVCEAFGQQASSSGAARIVIGPNILVSKADGDVPHAETVLVANPKDPKNLIGASILFSTADTGTTARTYASKDGGNTWQVTVFADGTNGSDPSMGISAQGTVYYGMTFGKLLYRSEDGGFTWAGPIPMLAADHPIMVVDQTFGKYSGRIYVSAISGNAKNPIGILRSEDGGRTFIGPVAVPTPEAFYVFNLGPLVMSDGTLFVPFQAWDKKEGVNNVSTWFVTSPDGGITFSAPTRVTDIYYKDGGWGQPKSLHGYFNHIPRIVYAVDPTNDNHLYVAWHDRRLHYNRVFFSYSHDRGKTWSAPALVSPDVRAESSQFQPMLAVNKDGTIGLAWFDTRDAKPEEDYYHLYFSASIDGGPTFLPARRISTLPSYVIGTGNLRPYTADINTKKGNTGLRFRTNFARWPDGGDYVGFVADRDGVFHPLWPDSRSGTAQLYTARISVVRPETSVSKQSTATAPGPRVKSSLNGKVALVPDPAEYDAQRGEALIPIRLKNISTSPIYGPITVEITQIKDWTILNANNDKEGVGAVFEYTGALADLGVLEPGGLSEAVLWKLKYPGYGKTPSFNVEVIGYTDEVQK